MSRDEKRRAHVRPHILVVSDDASLSEFLEEGLTIAGFWTSVIASGLQTLEVFRLRRFDLIVIDAHLSGFDGFELVRRLRGGSDRVSSSGPRSDAPITFIAENDAAVSQSDATNIGADSVLYAPIELESLAQHLHGLFERWRQDHPDAPLADEALVSVPES